MRLRVALIQSLAEIPRSNLMTLYQVIGVAKAPSALLNFKTNM